MNTSTTRPPSGFDVFRAAAEMALMEQIGRKELESPDRQLLRYCMFLGSP
jgi:hypothetical protein